jgi:antitoxin (DNA-binding transcriptional repressor) of toxin-antitoxin stability system
MDERITATRAARSFSDLLNRVRYRKDRFIIVRGGEAVALLTPPPPSESQCTLANLLQALASAAPPDEGFADDLEVIQEEQPSMPDVPWDS